jgi:hypothetical protein
MTRLIERCADALSHLLDPDERIAVLGDLTEIHAPSGHAIWQLTGLIVRRYAAEWRAPGPWLALVGAVVPIGIVLSFVSRWWSDLVVHDLRIYAITWIPGYLEFPGVRHDMIGFVTSLCEHGALLFLWSWTLGYTSGRLARKSSWLVGAGLVVVLFAATLGTTDTVRQDPFGRPSPLLALCTLAAAIVRVSLTLAPAALGVCDARYRQTPPSRRSALALTAATILLTIVTLPGVQAAFAEGALAIGRHVVPALNSDEVTGGSHARLFEPWALALMLWPSAYVTTISFRHRSRQHT